MQAYEFRLMAEETRITLKYSGPSVEDGTLPLQDVVDALQGFSGAYSKIARLRSDGVEHELRVSAIKQNSFDVHIVAWLALANQAETIESLKIAYHATRWVIERIFKMMEVKKHAANQPISVAIEGANNTVVAINASGAKLVITPELLDLIRDKTLDADLNKIVSPLEPHKVESAELTAETEGQPVLKEKVNTEEREFFRPISVETTKDSEIVGKFVSLNKENNRGTFELSNGKHVPYRYSGPDPDSFHMTFARKGPIRVEGKVSFDENLEPTQVEVRAAHHLQKELPL